jgi:FAD:protein FMN transferase
MKPSFPVRDKLLRRCRPLLGTFVEVTAPDEPAIAAGFAAIAEVQQLLSAHDPASELSRLNRLGFGQPVALDALTCLVLRRALHWAEASGGGFDPTIGGLMAARGLLPADHTSLPVDPAANWRDVHVDGHSARFSRRLRLDLGGIAKGLAVDRAIDAIRASGAECALVNAGGDIRAFGPDPWLVSVVTPGSRQPLAVVELDNAALATSAGHDDDGKLNMDHLVGACSGIASVTVQAPSAMDADALTKILLSDSPRAAHCLALVGASALQITQDGRVVPHHHKDF